MNRADLSWALSAVLPHAGKPPRPSFVGIEHHENHLYVYSTDRYTLGIARIERHAAVHAPLSCQLTPKEATELEQFVRPRRVPERVQEALLVVEGNELHVGWDVPGVGFESAVFETIEPVLNWQTFLDLTALGLSRETAWQPVKVNPAFLARFAKAERDGHAVRIEPKQGTYTGSLLVTAGDSFIGLAMQIAYSQPATAVDFPSWPLPSTWNERKAS